MKENIQKVLNVGWLSRCVGWLCCGSAVAILLAACSSDDDLKGYVPNAETIEIVQNELLFPSVSSSATVEVGTDVTATLDATWCTATVSGHVVTVTAEANHSFEGRTALLTLTNGNASRHLPVQQLGMVLGTMPVSNRYAPTAGDDFTYTIRHDEPMTVATSEAWVHATLDGEQLHVTIDSNEGGHIRRGLVITESAGYRDTLTIAQYDRQNDIVGSYYILGYYGGNPDAPTATRFDLVERNDSLFMNWSGSFRYGDTYIYVPFDETTATLTFFSAFTLLDGSSTDTGYFFDSDGHICSSKFAGASCQMYYSEQSGLNAARTRAYNWPGHDIYGFCIRSYSIVTTTLFSLTNIVIMRAGPVGTKIE